jgi:KaiC/GvpD/RAD55 family RecA-like ATPase
MDKPPSKTRYGASPDDWALLDLTVGIGSDLLPVVSNPNAEISPNSTMKALGKTPSRYDRDRKVVGIARWTEHQASDAEIARWSAEPDYGISAQTRVMKGVDIDIDDGLTVSVVVDKIIEMTGQAVPIRWRSNSSKALVPLRCEAEFPKRVIRAANGMIELLSNGQQFVAFGTHPSGARYEWSGPSLAEMPVLTLEQVDALWAELEARFAIEPSTTSKASTSTRGEHLDVEDPVADWLEAEGLVTTETRRGALVITCPWSHEHSSDTDGSTSTVWFRAGTNGHPTGHFRCQHAHCEHRNRQDFLAAVGYPDDRADDFEDLGPDPEAGKDDKSPSELSAFAFKLQPIHEFAAQPSGGWIVKNVIPRAELGIIYGASGSGKTFIILDIALAVARGVPWRGLRVKQGRVVYIVAEGAGGFRKRARAYAQQHDIDLKDVDVLVLDAVPNLLDDKQVKLLTKAIEAAGAVSMIVVDTFAQMTPGANENAAEDMGKAINHVRSVGRKVGACVALVHHAGKDAAKGARGWSGLRAAADFELEVTRDGDNRTLNTTKQKDADDQEQWGFRLEEITIGIDEDGDDITSCVIAESDVTVDAGVRGGQRRAKPKEKMGDWERALLDVYAELSVGGDVRKSDLITKAADTRPDAGTVKVRRGNVRAALKKMRAGKDSYFLPPEPEIKEDLYVMQRT